MRKTLVIFLIFSLIFEFLTVEIYGEPYVNKVQEEQKDTIKAKKRGAFRSPRRSYNPGIEAPGRTTPPRQDKTVRNPAKPKAPTPRTGFRGMLGGFTLGTILGYLFNPFAGFSLGFPLLSLLSLALWFIIILAVVRLFRRRKEY